MVSQRTLVIGSAEGTPGIDRGDDGLRAMSISRSAVRVEGEGGIDDTESSNERPFPRPSLQTTADLCASAAIRPGRGDRDRRERLVRGDGTRASPDSILDRLAPRWPTARRVGLRSAPASP